MWLGALIAGTVLSALFLIITLAKIEAGTKGKSGWLALTFCSLAAVAGLIIFKPETKMEQVQYMPAPPPVLEEKERKGEVVKKSAPRPAEPAGGPAVEKKSPGNALSEKSFPMDGIERRDPLLEEILSLKRQAMENRQKSASGEPAAADSSQEEQSGEQSGASGSVDNNSGQQTDHSGEQKPEERQDTSLSPDGRTDQQNNAESSDKEDRQQDREGGAVRAKVLVSSLNVRDKSGLDGAVISTLKAGDVVEIVHKAAEGEWVEIKLNSGQTGWLMKKYIEILP